MFNVPADMSRRHFMSHLAGAAALGFLAVLADALLLLVLVGLILISIPPLYGGIEVFPARRTTRSGL